VQEDVPVGWRTGVTAAGDSGFVSPAPHGERAWAVRERRNEAPVTSEHLAQQWVEELRRGWPRAEVEPLEQAEVAGWPGKEVQVAVADGNLVLQWRGAARGLWSVEEVWQVERAREARLTPLRSGLQRSVTWRDPEVLADAMVDVDDEVAGAQLP